MVVDEVLRDEADCFVAEVAPGVGEGGGGESEEEEGGHVQFC